jgi:hypothetical protein
VGGGFIPDYRSIPLPPIFRTLFQVPYPASPLFATLPKTAGVCGILPILELFTLPQRSNVQTCGRSNVLLIYPLSFQILAHSFAARKIVSRLFSKASALFAKNHPGWGEGVSLSSTFRRSDVSTFKSKLRRSCGAQIPTWSGRSPFVPLQPNPLGATIGNGTKISLHPGKQLRSPRCLRIRERTSGTVRAWSPLQVVPRSSVLMRVSGFVLTNPELNWTGSAGWLEPASNKDAGKTRVGKAGSVRLG